MVARRTLNPQPSEGVSLGSNPREATKLYNMRTYKIIFTSNPVNDFWYDLLPQRVSHYEWFDKVINLEPTIIEVTEIELAKTLYNLINNGESFVIKY